MEAALLCFCLSSEVDIISGIEFDKTGKHLATRDRGGRVVLFDRVDHGVHRRVLEGMDCSSSRRPEFRYQTEFQSHEPKFDYLKSLEIEVKINMIRWCQTANSAIFLLSTNDKTIKFWKFQDKVWLCLCAYSFNNSCFFIRKSVIHFCQYASYQAGKWAALQIPEKAIEMMLLSSSVNCSSRPIVSGAVLLLICCFLDVGLLLRQLLV